MDEVAIKCGACGKENTKKFKPEPETLEEGKQIYFHCTFCRKINLRDGTIAGEKPQVDSIPSVAETQGKIDQEKFSFGDLLLLIFGVLAAIFGITQINKGNPKPPKDPNDPMGFRR